MNRYEDYAGRIPAEIVLEKSVESIGKHLEESIKGFSYGNLGTDFTNVILEEILRLSSDKILGG